MYCICKDYQTHQRCIRLTLKYSIAVSAEDRYSEPSLVFHKLMAPPHHQGTEGMLLGVRGGGTVLKKLVRLSNLSVLSVHSILT